MDTPLQILHKSLIENNYDVPEDFNSFRNTLTAHGNEGYQNRFTLWKSLKENGFDVPDSYESFSRTLFVPGKTGVSPSRPQGASNPTVASASVEPAQGAVIGKQSAAPMHTAAIEPAQGVGIEKQAPSAEKQAPTAETQAPTAETQQPVWMNRAPGIRSSEAPKAVDYGIPFKPGSQLTAAQHDEIVRHNNFAVRQVERMGRERREEEARRNQALVDTGDEKVNSSIIKTQGQWEDELDKGVQELGEKYVAPMVDKAMKEADAKYSTIIKDMSKATMGAPTGMTPMAAIKMANDATDPEKVLQALQESLSGLFDNPEVRADMKERANALGVPLYEYAEKIVAPSLMQDLQQRFDQSQIAKYLPKNKVDYILSGVSNTILGKLIDAGTETQAQRYYKNQAEAMTEEGQNPYYNPGAGAKFAKIGVEFGGDAGFFGIYGKVSGEVAMKLAERQIQKLVAKGLSDGAARSIVGSALENSVGARMKNYLMQHIASSSLTMGQYNLTSEAARQMRDREFNAGQLLGSTAEGLAVGAAFGATGGVTQALSQPLSGFAKVGAKVAGFGAEAETMYATEELAKMLHGEEGFDNPFEGSVEALMKLGVMKLSSPEGITKVLGEVFHPVKSNQRQRTGVSFTEDEQNYIRNSVEGRNLVESLSQLHPETSIQEVNGKKQLTTEGEALRSKLAENYDAFMENKDILASAKAKVASIMGGIYRPGLEVGADIIQNENGSVIVKTRDRDGNCIQDIRFDDLEQAQQWQADHLTQLRRNDAVNMWNGATPEQRQAIVDAVKNPAKTQFVADELERIDGMNQKRMQRELGKLNESAEALNEREMTDEDAYKYVQAVIKDGSNEVFDGLYDIIHENAVPADELNTKRNYFEGTQVTPEQRHQAMLDAQRAEDALYMIGGDFANEVIGAAEYPDEKMAELAGRKDITGKQLLAALRYYNLASKANGMMDEAIKDVDQQVEAANAVVRRNTHAGSGQLIEVSADGKDYYLTAGKVTINPDGSIDASQSGDAMIVRDKATGEIEVLSPSVLRVTAINDPARLIEANESQEGLRGQLMKQASDNIELAPGTPEEPQPGDIFLGADGTRYMTMQLQDGTWAKYALDENGDLVGEPTPLDVDEYRKAKSVEIDEVYAPKEEMLEEPAQEDVAEEPGTAIEEEPTQGVSIEERSGDLDNAGGETGADGTGGNNPSATTPSPAADAAGAVAIPVDEKGRPQYDKAKPEDTLAELNKTHGEETAQKMIAQLAANTAKKLDELQKKDVSDITDMDELDAYYREVADMQRKADYWQGLIKRPEPTGETAETETNTVGKWSLSNKKASNGESFYQDENGNIDLVDIPQEIFDEIGYTKAPLRLTPSMLSHVRLQHGKETGITNDQEAIEFITDVMKNFDHVRLGNDGALIFSVENGRSKTGKRAITILLNSDNGEFYGIKTSGYEAVDRLNKRPLLWEGSAKISPSSDAASETVTSLDAQQGGEQSGSASDQSNALSEGKDTKKSNTLQENQQKNDVQESIQPSQGAGIEKQTKTKTIAEPTAEQKIAQGTVKQNIGKRFSFRNQDGTRSEVVINGFSGEDMVRVSRQDYDAQGNAVGDPYDQDFNLVDVGNTIVNGIMKPVKSIEERLRPLYKTKVGDIPLLDVLTEKEQQQLLTAIEKNDKELVGNLTSDFIENHREDIILRGREVRNDNVSRIMDSTASREEKLRRIRKEYQGYDEALAMLEDKAFYPASAEDWVVALHGRVPKSGEGKLAYFSYDQGGKKVVGMQDETGYGTKTGGDTKGFAPWLAPAGKGMSLKQYAETIHSQLPEAEQERYSDQDIRNAILEVFGSAERPSDIPMMNIRRGVIQAEEAVKKMEEMWMDDNVSFQKVSRGFANRLKRAIEITNTEPTEAQKEAGNYRKGHVSFGGYDFTIENPAGSVRRGTDQSGKAWEQKMNNTYGYILGKYGKDGDHLDMFLNDGQDLDNWDGMVYVVDQVNPKTGEFDEHKVMYGFDSEESARQAYLSNYNEGWKGLGKITGVSKELFDKWLDTSKRKLKPFADYSAIKNSVERKIQGLEDYSEDEIKKYVREFVQEQIENADVDAEIVDIAIIGSRINGNADADSDLDVLVEYKGKEREDDFFNVLSEADEPLVINGIKVDINPITAGKSGTITEFLERNSDYKKEKTPELTREQDKVLRDAIVEAMAPEAIIDDKIGQQVLKEHNEQVKLSATSSEDNLNFHKVSDKELLERLESQPTVKRYRAMQLIDGKLYPPMSAKVDGEMRQPTEIGVWEQAEERPDLVKSGKFVLRKGQKGQSDVPAAYNPYFHTSTSGLNDQFTSAHRRPELVVVEVEIPESELTSGYKAEGAKDAVGDTPWHSGPVNGKLPADRKRTVTLSRYSKVTRIVPDAEVAEMIAKQLEGTGVEIPYNVVTPALRKELEARGVKVSEQPSGSVGKQVKMQKVSKEPFYSNAAKAVEGISQEKATPEQWLKMIEKAGGLKAGEDKWIGLSDWLKEQQKSGKKTLTKQEVADYIRENQIQIEEQHYSEYNKAAAGRLQDFNKEFTELCNKYFYEIEDNVEVINRAYEDMVDRYGDDFRDAFEISFNGTGDASLIPVLDWNDEPSGAARYFLGEDDGERTISPTRLSYTTNRLKNKREIALVVPTIEPYKEGDHVHFGDAGEGRAVAWVRFGETVDADGKRVLVIDEIQSKRHQEGREKGYKSNMSEEMAELENQLSEARSQRQNYLQQLRDKYNDEYPVERATSVERSILSRIDQQISQLNDEINNTLVDKVPDAPFEKNWHELAMKRMLRYAAENGYDKVAWTTGEQQAERYNIGNVANSVLASDWQDFSKFAENAKDCKMISIYNNDNAVVEAIVNRDGKIIKSPNTGLVDKNLAEVVGKEMAIKLLSDGLQKLEGEQLRIGGEGMKGFYDQMLPRFMDKYGKKWGVKTGEIDLPEIGQKMHAVVVTPEMKESVMQGQPMFFKTPGGDEAYGFTLGGKMYIDPRIATSETPVHEYGHLWAEMKRRTAPEEWNEIKGIILNDEAVQPFIDKVRDEYPELIGKEDDFAEEVLTQYSGKRGAEKLRRVAAEIAAENGGIFGKAQAVAALQKMKNLLDKFWRGVAKMMGWKYTNAEEIADKMLYDLLSGVDPTKRESARGAGIEDRKQRQLEIVTKENPMKDDYHTGIRSVEDIKTYEEAVKDEPVDDNYTPDYTKEIVAKALETGKITVYSSYPITNGTFVTPSKMEAQNYAGREEVYSQEVPLKDVAWIDPMQGQYARVLDEIKPQLVGKEGADKADKAEGTTMRQDKLKMAEEAEKEGMDAHSIKFATGWERGKDGQWRYETVDAKADVLTPYTKKLNELKAQGMERPLFFLTLDKLIGKDNELFNYYPDMKGMPVYFDPTIDDGVAGSFDGSKISINSNHIGRFGVKELDNEDLYGTLLHEIQHAVQEKEGFAKGGSLQTSTTKEGLEAIISKKEQKLNHIKIFLDANRNILNEILNDPAALKDVAELEQRSEKEVKDRILDKINELASEYDSLKLQIDRIREVQSVSLSDAKDLYRRLAGEVEARNASNRMNMTDEERMTHLAEETEDTPRNDQVVIMGDGMSASMSDDIAEKEKSATSYTVRGSENLAPVSVSDSGYKVKDLIWKSQENDQKLLGITDKDLLSFRDGEAKVVPLRDNAKITAKQKRERQAFAERQWRRAHDDAEETVKKLNLGDRVTIVDSIDELEGHENFSDRKKRAKGWYDPETGQITIVMGNHRSPQDVVSTILHEGVSHHGLRQLFGQHFDTFLDNVYRTAESTIRKEISVLSKKYDGDVRKGTEEYLARLAEDTDFERAINSGWWAKIKDWFVGMLRDLGLPGFSDVNELSDNELRYVLWRSYENLAEPGRYKIPANMEKLAKVVELPVSKKIEDQVPMMIIDHKDEISIEKKVAEMTIDEVREAYKRLDDMMRDENGLDLEEQEETRKAEYIKKNGLEGIGPYMANFTKEIMDKYGSGLVTLRWELQDRLFGAGNYAREDDRELFSDSDMPESELTPEERQYWKRYEEDMAKWKARHGLPEDAERPGTAPKMEAGESSLKYAQRLVQYNREKALWNTAPKIEDYRQERLDKDVLEDARSEEQRYPTSQSAKMRRVAAELTRIRHAVSQQKAYDKATVKAVTDFAQDFMRMGFGDNLRRGEMERMLSSVKNAVGAKNIKAEVDNILNILIDNHLRQLDQAVQKLSSVKELKQTAKGVEAQGKLELKGQRMIQAFREARQTRMTADDIRLRMGEVAEKMSRDDDEAPMWEQEYEGLSIALQYADDIEASRQEFAELDRAYKDAVADYKSSGRSYQAQQELLESIEQSKLENKIERIGKFADVIGRLQGNIAESIEGAKEFVEREKERVRHIHSIANFDLAGKSADAMRQPTNMSRLANSTGVRFFLGSLGTFEQMLKQFGSRNVSGQGYLYDYFMGKWLTSTDNAYINEVKAKEELDAKAKEIFGDKVKRWSDLYDVSNSKGMDIRVVDQGNEKTLSLTQGNMLYIYMVNKMTDGKMKLRSMGITEEDVERIKEEIDPRLVQLGDWLQDDYMVSRRVEYNKVHERMFGAPMAAIDHYFPIKILGDARVQEQDVANMSDQDAVLPSTITGSIIKRRRNTLPLDILNTDALSLALEHVEDMERWAAQAEWNKDVNTLLSYTTFRNKVKNMTTIYGSGDQLWNAFADAARMAAGTYRPKVKPGSVDKAITNIAKGVTAAKISFRVYTAFKQLLSAPAFLHDVNLADFAKYSVNPYGSWKWAMENMPVFQKRWKSRQVGDTRLMEDATDWKLWKNNIVQLATRLGMSPNALVDGVTCAVGARAIYDTRYKKYKAIGASDEVAHKRALRDAEIGYNLTQQSSEGAFVSRIQKDRTVAANMLSVFRNSSMSYTRQWVDASRNLKRMMQKGYREDSIAFMARQYQEQFGLDADQARNAAEKEYNRAARHEVARLLNMMFGVTVAWNLGASLPYLLIGDDDETKKEMMEDALIRGMLAGPTEGLVSGNLYSEFISRSIASEETRRTFRESGFRAALESGLEQGGDYEVNPLPLFADIQNMIKKLGYDKYAAAQDVFNICVQSAVGVNPQTFTDMWNACMDYGNPSWMPFTDTTKGNKDLANPKEIALFIMRLMNAPTSSWRNKYIDELGMDVDEAKKLSYDEMAKRYANYKHWKDAPIMGWLRGKEGRQEKMEKIRNQFDKEVKKRLQRADYEALRDNFDNTDDEAEKKQIIGAMKEQAKGLDTKELLKQQSASTSKEERKMLKDVITKRAKGEAEPLSDDNLKDSIDGASSVDRKNEFVKEYAKRQGAKDDFGKSNSNENYMRLREYQDVKEDIILSDLKKKIKDIDNPGIRKYLNQKVDRVYGQRRNMRGDDEATAEMMKDIRKDRREAIEAIQKALDEKP